MKTRLSLLRMSILRYVNDGTCCFFPGKVLDEFQRLCQVIRTNADITRPYELLRELRDISSMAMEHFEDVLLPLIRRTMRTGLSRQDQSDLVTSLSRHPVPIEDVRAAFRYRRKHLLNSHTPVIADLATHRANRFRRSVSRLMTHIRCLTRRQSSAGARYGTVSRLVCKLLTRQRELSRQNKQLNALVRAQSQSIRRLEEICGVSGDCPTALEKNSLKRPRQNSTSDDVLSAAKKPREDNTLLPTGD